MIVVSDTTPINYLVLVGQINILAELFGRVLIPQAVWDEVHNPGYAGSSESMGGLMS